MEKKPKMSMRERLSSMRERLLILFPLLALGRSGLRADGFEIPGAINLLDQVQDFLQGAIGISISVVSIIITGLVLVANKDSRAAKTAFGVTVVAIIIINSAPTIVNAIWSASAS